MYDLTRFTLKDVTTCGAALRQMADGAASMEETANRIVDYLYHNVGDEDGRPASVLVRFFITRPYVDLDPDLQTHVDRFLGRKPEDPSLKCQTLLATIGDDPAWHSRHHSRYYKVHPLSAEIVDVNPMFGQVAQLFGIVLEKTVDRDPDLLIDLEHQTYNILHIADVVSNPYVPAQDDFVVPYGIKSVLGFYGMLPSGNLFTLLLFTKVQIPRDALDAFRPLALNLKMAVLPFDDGTVFATDAGPAPNPQGTTAQFRSEAAGLAQLLSVHERVVVEQSDRIAQVVAELEAQIAENERLRKLATEAAVAAERTRLSRDLHDSVTQALYSQTLYAEAAVRQLQSGRTERVEHHLHQLKETALQALREMRLLIFELRPAAVEEEGLVSALRTRLESVESRTGIDADVIVDESFVQLTQLSPAAETGLYWVAQEALNNALKYAAADQITISLSATTEPGLRCVILKVTDNGGGFDLSAPEKKGTLGLRGIQERARQLGGALTIHSAPGAGTTIHIEVPHAD